MQAYTVQIEVKGLLTGKPCIPPVYAYYQIAAASVEDAGETALQAAREDGWQPVGVSNVRLREDV